MIYYYIFERDTKDFLDKVESVSTALLENPNIIIRKSEENIIDPILDEEGLICSREIEDKNIENMVMTTLLGSERYTIKHPNLISESDVIDTTYRVSIFRDLRKLICNDRILDKSLRALQAMLGRVFADLGAKLRVKFSSIAAREAAVENRASNLENRASDLELRLQHLESRASRLEEDDIMVIVANLDVGYQGLICSWDPRKYRLIAYNALMHHGDCGCHQTTDMNYTNGIWARGHGGFQGNNGIVSIDSERGLVYQTGNGDGEFNGVFKRIG